MPVFDFLLDPQHVLTRWNARQANGGPLAAAHRLPEAVCSTPPTIPTLGQLSDLCGQDEESWFLTGLYVLNREEVVAAEHCFRALLRLNRPKWEKQVDCLANLGQALKLQGRWDEAEQWLRQATELAPKAVAIRKSLIEVMRSLERPAADSLHHVELALKEAPDDDDLQNLQRQLQAELAPSPPTTREDAEESSP